MDKRLILAIALSLLVLVTWSLLSPKPQHIANKEVTEQSTVLSTPQAVPVALLAAEQKFPPSSLISFPQGQYAITFVEPLAAIKEIQYSAYQNYKFPLKYGLWLADKSLDFKRAGSLANEITFVHSDTSKRISKRFIVSGPDYYLILEVSVQNLSSSPLKVNLPLIVGVLDSRLDISSSRYQDVAVATESQIGHFSARKRLEKKEVQFVSLRDQYFCAIVEPKSDYKAALINVLNRQESEVSLLPQEVELAAGQQMTREFHIYLGPQDLQSINQVNPRWSAVVHFGTFDFIAQILLKLLEFLYKLVHNWGVAIIVLSLLVYLMLYPLTLKQMRSMKEMQALQPHIEELRKTYKDNPQRLNKEIMELYRRHKVNPLSGCLPLLLQMPIFFALYQALIRSVALKGATFLWIKDLSEPDRLFRLSVSLPILGNEINILPIAMTIGMFIQQKMSMAAASSGSAEQQKIMLIVFPLMFGFIFYHMPSGLVLYWFINSALMLFYQFRIQRAK